jgi:hypothetical protein
MDDLASRLAHRVQLTTDGYKPYLTAVDEAFGSRIDCAMLEKSIPSRRMRMLRPDTALPNVVGRAD